MAVVKRGRVAEEEREKIRGRRRREQIKKRRMERGAGGGE